MIQGWCSLLALATGRTELVFSAMESVFLLEEGREDQIFIFGNIELEMMPSHQVGIWICESGVW